MISFNNTEQAFKYKTDAGLKRANFLFSVIGNKLLLKLGLNTIPTAVKWNIPFMHSIVKATIFEQFVGGETMQESVPLVDKLGKYHVQVIMDYAVEGGDYGEAAYAEATKQFIEVVNFAATQTNIPFMSIKVTGLARTGLLQKLNTAMQAGSGTLMVRYKEAVKALLKEEQAEWENVVNRLRNISLTAKDKRVGVLIDAEETWIHDPVDAITLILMDELNKQEAIVYNTYQMYRHDRLKFLEENYLAAKERGFILGAKLVRGAYMEKERARALEKNYPSPIQPDKESCDRDYDAGVKFCIDHLNEVSLILASHNEHSNMAAALLMDEHNIAHNHKHIHFSQLYGLSDQITFNLAAAGFNVSKYLPFGPIKDVVPYLMRRAEENTSVSGQTSRELQLIKTELKRRRGAK